MKDARSGYVGGPCLGTLRSPRTTAERTAPAARSDRRWHPCKPGGAWTRKVTWLKITSPARGYCPAGDVPCRLITSLHRGLGWEKGQGQGESGDWCGRRDAGFGPVTESLYFDLRILEMGPIIHVFARTGHQFAPFWPGLDA